VRQKGRVREVLQARRVVSHDVIQAREKGSEVAVAVATLVGAAVVAQE
jgi:hypothetical protein